MVRGPSALLIPSGVALLYLLLAPALPAPADADAATLAAGTAGALAVAACAFACLPARDEAPVLVLLGLGAGLLAAALTQAGAGAPATVAKALVASAAGMALAHAWRELPAALIGVPLVGAGIDALSVASGPAPAIVRGSPDSADFLSLSLPAWSEGAILVGVSDAIFLGMFAAWAFHYRLRARVTLAALALATPAALALSLLFERAVPALPLLAVALLAPNVDGVARALRGEAAPAVS